MVKIFDTHAHYDDSAYDGDRDILLMGFKEQGVGAVTNIGTNLHTSGITADMTKRYENVYGAVGVYPTEVGELSDSACAGGIEELRRLVQDYDKVVAIGEIGLDYHYRDADKALQKKWFAEQMELARSLGVPIVVHSRDAARDTADIMHGCRAGELGGVIHCYSYTKEMAKEFLDMDFYFGIGGVLTFKNARKLREAVAYIPLARLVLETDSPYLTPEPFRGRRNTSANLPYVAQVISEIKGISVDEVYEATWENAHALYRLVSCKE